MTGSKERLAPAGWRLWAEKLVRSMLKQGQMNNRQTNLLNMYRAVVNVQTKNATATASVPAVARQTAALASTLDTIGELSRAQEASSKGITLDKTRIREILINATLATAGAVASWASENNNEEVRVKMTFSPSGLKGSTDRELATSAHTVATEAAKHDLGEFGAGPLALEAFNAKIAAFDAIADAPRQATIATSAVTKALDEQFRLADRIVKERMDKLMEQFRESQAQFFNEYKAARIIVDRGGGQSASATPAPAAPKSTPAPAPAAA